MLVEIAAVKIRVAQDRAARHIVERDVLRGKMWRGGNRQHMTYPLGKNQRPLQRLHPTQAASDHCRKLPDAEQVSKARLRFHPVFHRDHRKIRSVRLASLRVDGRRAGRAVAAAEIVQPDHKKFIGIDRLTGTDHVVPPADVFWIVRIIASDVMMPGQCVANQDRIGFCGIQLAVSLIHQLIARQHRAAAENQRGIELRAPCADDADTVRYVQNGYPKNKTRSACAGRVDSL